MTFSVDSKLSAGNLRIIITNESGSILYDLQPNSKDTISFTAEDGKIYYLKCVAESASFSATVERTVN